MQWLPPLSGNDPVQTVSQPGTYQCSITVCGIVTLAEIEVIASNLSVVITDPGPFDICNDSTVLLSADPGLMAYLWIPSLATGESVLVGPGQYSVIGFDQYGCTDTAGVAIVNAIAFTDSVQGSATAVCAGGTSLAIATGSGALQWFDDAAGTQPIGSGASISYGPLFSNTTIYVLQTENGCTSDVVLVPIDVLPVPPTLPIQGDTLLCVGDTLYLFLDPNNFFPQTWTLPSGGTLNQPPYSTSANPGDAGWYSATYPNNQTGCSSVPDSALVTVFSNPDPGLPPTALICIGDLLILQADPGEQAYSWSTGAESPAITVTDVGTYVVTVTNEDGCSATDSTVVNEGPAIWKYPT